jgi:hypothetical protein
MISLLGSAAFATDLQMVVSNTISGGAVPSVSVVVRKVTANALREDFSPAASMLFLSGTQGRINLNHSEKTYSRQPSDPAIAPSPTAPNVIRENTRFEGRPAEACRWTNSGAWGCVWIAEAAPFLGKLTNFLSGPAIPVAMIPGLSVGATTGSNSIVVATEYSKTFEGGLTENGEILVFSLKSKLLSIVATNFSATEFEIPPDYKEVPLPALGISFVTPVIFGSKATSENKLEGLQKRYNNGNPVLRLPPGTAVNH